MSAGFVFRLEAVLQQRVQQVRTAQLALARAVTVRVAAARQLEGSMCRLEAARSGGASLDGRTFDPLSRMNTLYYLDCLEQSIQQQRLHLDELAAHEMRARLLLVQATQGRQTLERLRERKQQEARREQELLVARQLDDLVTTRFAPTPQEGGPAHAA